jgi:anti-anti-sigma regulatory factor
MALAARGVLLKGAATLVAGGGFLFGLISLANPAITSQYLFALGTLVLVAILTFFLAHFGWVRTGGYLITSAQLLFITFFGSTPADILSGTHGAVYILPVVMAGMVIGARALLPAAIGACLLIASIPLTANYPWPPQAIVTIFVILGTATLLWLIMQMLERMIAGSRQQAQATEAARAALAEQADSLHASNARLTSANQQLEEMVTLIRELETPVIPLLAGVLVAPLVGHLTSRRLDEITQTILTTVYDSKAHLVIVDITAIPAMDTQVIQQLNQLADAVQLLGATVMLTGMSPEVAQTIAQLGLSFADIQTAARLENALADVLQQALQENR